MGAVITDQHLLVLLGAHRHQSYREIAKLLGNKAVGTVQQRFHELEEEGLVAPMKKRRARSRTLTLAGLNLLRRNNLE